MKAGAKMGWMMRLHEGNIWVGPNPSQRDESVLVVETLEIRNMVCLCSDPKKDLFYMEHWKKHVKDVSKHPAVHRKPLPADLETWNESKQMKWYITTAREVAKLQGPIYIHNASGRDEEAIVGFIVWAIQNPNTCPINLNTWLNDHHHILAIDNEDKRRMTQACIKEAKKRQNPGLTKFFKKC